MQYHVKYKFTVSCLYCPPFSHPIFLHYLVREVTFNLMHLFDLISAQFMSVHKVIILLQCSSVLCICSIQDNAKVSHWLFKCSLNLKCMTDRYSAKKVWVFVCILHPWRVFITYSWATTSALSPWRVQRSFTPFPYYIFRQRHHSHNHNTFSDWINQVVFDLISNSRWSKFNRHKNLASILSCTYGQYQNNM